MMLIGCAAIPKQFRSWTLEEAVNHAIKEKNPRACWYAAKQYSPSKNGECSKEAKEIAYLLDEAEIEDWKMLAVKPKNRELMHHAIVLCNRNDIRKRHYILHQHGCHSGKILIEAIKKFERAMGCKEYDWPNTIIMCEWQNFDPNSTYDSMKNKDLGLDNKSKYPKF